MAKKKTHDKFEHIKGENRRLRKKVKTLQKELQRALHSDFEKLYEEDEVEHPERNEAGCPKCGKELQSLELGIKTIILCKECDYRKVKNNGDTSKK